jgi:hypothetical protein
VPIDQYDARMSRSVRRRWERVKALVRYDEKYLAREALGPIYRRVLRAAPADRRWTWTHAIGHFVGNYNKMWDLATGGSISRYNVVPDPDSLKAVMAYPRAYREVVTDVAEEFEIPPHLVWSIMRQESRYKPGAISHTNAVGALQMIPRTARKVARDLGTTYNPRTFFRPSVGFRFSGFYMRKLMDTFEGLVVPMASSYNSGPTVVKRWFERNPDASFPWLIEEFEYNEGRNYGRKVAEHMLRYLYLYEKDPERRGALLDRMFPLDRDIDLPDDVGY